jgi:hypothetical protein
MDTITKGICVYGYDSPQALSIQASIKTGLHEPISLISASGQEDKTLLEILQQHEHKKFQQQEPRIVVFFHFEDALIPQLLNLFPLDIPRPIFCCATPSNQMWSFQTLIEQLLEEEHYMKTRSQP